MIVIRGYFRGEELFVVLEGHATREFDFHFDAKDCDGDLKALGLLDCRHDPYIYYDLLNV